MRTITLTEAQYAFVVGCVQNTLNEQEEALKGRTEEEERALFLSDYTTGVPSIFRPPDAKWFARRRKEHQRLIAKARDVLAKIESAQRA